MLHPIGQLPSQVYWRRRMLLIGMVVALSLAAGWFFIGGASGDPDADAADAAADTSSAESTGDGPLTALEQVLPSLSPAEPDNPADSGTPAAGSTPVPAPPAEPGPCPDEAIGLAVGAEFAQYSVGSKPLLGLSVSNISAVPCLRDLDVALQTWGIFAADGTRLWGSNDCYPDPSVPNVVLLQPGQLVNFTIIWSGQSSEPTCTLPRQELGAGSYILRGYLNTLVSPDAALVLV